MPRPLTLALAAVPSLVLSGLALPGPAGAAGASGPVSGLLSPRGGAPAISGDAGNAQAGIVDESALRYYAAQKQTDRVQAEIRRLRRLHPGWNPPGDLDTLQPSPPEEAPLWDLFTAGRFDALQAAIAARKAEDPDWSPSADLSTKLARALLRSRVKAAAESGDWGAIVARVEANPAVLDRGEVDILWLVAEAYARTGRDAQAAAIYRSILDTSTDPNQRLATIQKALGSLSIAEVDPLLALGRDGPDGAGEFRSLRTDITRARIVAVLHDEPSGRIDPADLSAFGDYARRGGDPGQLSLLGWYAYHRRQFREALDWFKLAISRGGDAQVAQGLAQTLRELGQDRDAEEVAYGWRALPANANLYVDIMERRLTQPNPAYIEPDRIDRFARFVLATSSGEGAQALGWYAYHACQFETALEWFQRATAWLPRESVILGHTLSLMRLKRPREAAELINRYDGLYPRVVDIAFRSDEGGEPDACAPARPAEARPAGGRPADPRAAAGAPRIAQVPSPVAPAPAGRAAQTRRSDFPIAVVGDNPMRFFPAGSPALDRVRDGDYRRDPRGDPPLVARRVPGVGAMPYERLGYALLPGWNGADAPGTPLADQRPAVGTLAQAEQTAAATAPQDARPRPQTAGDRFAPFGQANLDDARGSRSVR
ncbi:MAG: hypothetical protein PGN34_25035 [Methylobacterium frigidaeris]